MNILTFDFEEWFTYIRDSKGRRSYWEPILENYLDTILELLDQHNTKATFFCLGIIAKTDPRIIKKIAQRGHDIGCHSYNHRFISDLNYDTFREDTKKALDLLEQVIGNKIVSYRAPAFSINEKTKWALEILMELGIEIDSSIFPSNRRHGGFPTYPTGLPAIISIGSNKIKEFPISYVYFFTKKSMYSGGGYFRYLPFFLAKKFFKKSNYNMAYLHLRDFDSKQKKKLSLQYFTNYYGIKKCFLKFQKLLTSFEFLSISQASERIDWKAAHILYF